MRVAFAAYFICAYPCAKISLPCLLTRPGRLRFVLSFKLYLIISYISVLPDAPFLLPAFFLVHQLVYAFEEVLKFKAVGIVGAEDAEAGRDGVGVA